MILGNGVSIIYKTDRTVLPESEVEDCEQGVSVKS
jgi:hypothetical protein